jgi:CO/xanthine dehydrogenase Mo-binding subunit
VSASKTHDAKLKVIGTTPVRPDGVDKVTGRAAFADDLRLPGMLVGKVLRSPHAHARIRSIDTRRAMSLPGVHAIVTGTDFPKPKSRIVAFGEGDSFNACDLADNCIAGSKALYDGHAVAAVAADSAHLAEHATRLIEVDYEVLEPVLDVESALAEGTPAIHEKFTPGSFFVQSTRALPNAGYVEFADGDLDEGFRQATVIVERNFTTKTVHQGYIEPHAATAHWDAGGNLTVWSSTQGQFLFRDQLAAILNLPLNCIKVIPLEVGGAFGGKDSVYLEPLAALLSRKCGRPVKMVMSRSEVLRATGPASAAVMHVRLGADGHGRLQAADITLKYEAGAYPGGPVDAGLLTATTRYNIPCYRLTGFDVILNKPRVKPYRAPGATQVNFAVETVIDELARTLELDPLEFRLRNAMRTGDPMVLGVPCQVIGSTEILEAARRHPHYQAPLDGANQGRGVAYGFWYGGGGRSSVDMNVSPDGTVQVCTGSCDMSGTRMTLAMQTAEALGIEAWDVTVRTGDTQSVGYTLPAWGSRTTFATGIACIEAAGQVINQMTHRAAELWNIKHDQVVFEHGEFRDREDSVRRLSFRQLAAKLDAMGSPVSAQASVAPSGAGYQLAVYIVDVAVDPETAKVTVLRSTLLQDVGRAVHPDYVSGQMQGGVVQGLGWALHEEYFHHTDGTLANTTFLDYRMPTATDVPRTETVILETPNPAHPFGVRGAGEASIINPPAAVANAIYDAVGVRMDCLPMSPRALLAKLRQGGNRS